MRILLPLLALPLFGATAAESDESAASDQAVFTDFAEAEEANCRDTIQTARAERGQPLLQREAANPDEPILFLALDHEVDGCDVLLVSRDGDIRDLPQPDPGPLLQPAQ